MNIVPLLGLLLTLSCATTVPPESEEAKPMSSEEAEREPMLTYRLEAAESYRLGAEATIGFTLENTSAAPVWVLNWYTPLEGLYGNIFRITRDGEEVEYQGIMAKRGQPIREDYVRLGPGESASAEVDVAASYDLSIAAEYRVEFNGRIHDVVTEEASVPRVQDEHRGVEIPGNAVVFRVIGP